MQTDMFIERVMNHARGHEAADAKAATLAALQLLSEQMPPEEVRNLTPQLPEELAKPVGDVAGTADAVSDLDEFYEELATRADLKVDEATTYAHAVARALNDAITDGELENVKLVLPPELKDLLNMS